MLDINSGRKTIWCYNDSLLMMTDGRFSVLRDVLFPPLRLFSSVSERFWGVKVIYRRDAESKSEVKGE